MRQYYKSPSSCLYLSLPIVRSFNDDRNTCYSVNLFYNFDSKNPRLNIERSNPLFDFIDLL